MAAQGPHSPLETRTCACGVTNGLSPAGDRGPGAPDPLREGSSLSCPGATEQRSASGLGLPGISQAEFFRGNARVQASPGTAPSSP